MNDLLYRPEARTPRRLALLLGLLRFAVTGFFLFLAARNLAGDAHLASDFRRWGYSDGFRIFTAALQVAGAVLMLRPRYAFLGGGILTMVLIGAAVTRLQYDPLPKLAAPIAVMALVATLQWRYRPPLLR